MTTKSTKKQTEAEKLRERVKHLSVDLEYAGREGDSAYSERVNKKLDKLYNMLDKIASRAS
jgi:pyrroloquinoline quinone (PQQ) biosynthesis protein C